MAWDALPFNYLGVPLFSGRAKNIYFDPVIDKVRRAVDGTTIVCGPSYSYQSLACELFHLHYGQYYRSKRCYKILKR